jgi:hypothetical protein
MQSTSTDRDLAERGKESSEAKEKLERERLGIPKDDPAPVPVPPGLPPLPAGKTPADK